MAAKGDACAKALIEEVAQYLGLACVNFCRVFDPEMIVFAGGMAEAGEEFLTQIQQAFEQHAWTKFQNRVRLRQL